MDVFEGLYSSKCALQDSDGSLNKGPPGLHQPKDFKGVFRYSIAEKHSLEPIKVYTLLWGMKIIGDRNVNNMTKGVFSSVAKNVKKEVIEEISKEYLTKKLLPGYLDSLDAVRNYGKPKQLIIASMNPTAIYAKDVIDADDVVPTNRIVYKNGYFDHVDISMRNGKDKLEKTEEKLEEYGLTTDDCVFFANGTNDEPLARKCKLVLTNRWASPKIRKLENAYTIGDYSQFARRLQKEMPPVLQA
ncbi:MAG: hypothetical protein V1818_01315 [Candidatus Aenigmatarchaeota archaeon]